MAVSEETGSLLQSRSVLKVCVDGHGRRPGTNFLSRTPSSHFLGQCVHRGQLILRKISKIGASRCQILRLKCTKFDFRCWFAPDPLTALTVSDPAGRAYSAPPDLLDLLALFTGPTSKGREGKGHERGRERRGEGKGE